MTTTDMYQAAIAAIGIVSSYCGTARHVLANGDELFCSVEKVAGRSIVKGHMRTTWRLRVVGAEYSKPIAAKRATELLRQ